MKFVPKRELAPACLSWLAIGLLLLGGGVGWTEGEGVASKAASSVVLLTGGLLAWIWLGTSYRLDEDELVLQAGPIVKRLPYRRLVHLRPAAAWPIGLFSLRGHELAAGPYDRYSIAPRDMERFVRELRQRCPQLVVDLERDGRAS
ncbi:PH domain-containing protein [Paenibacillus albicereus]|uniref:PH domain-containing protein n=1 Tax=Paenibacillus albicereus TaxID=2726185 RepID=A0A6H2GSC0_9BACL|nr:PH domain-containing protein [Paenibacillus albicereus]QJC50323.1 PH domain-containing protein [Paenibacillus albicereus]